ncbi:YcnI family protein [Planosporangium flavigriseum]|uniref:Membrane protein n=1 Tax=Planosporangium flavigriseum TaxID=373681 RepID=A0A8J3LIC6_9ACTN|nr:YcnI family protein [Planosporangium flavigriseum]NJC65230.1 YcnI family protein [Planosporangium flavigriseum]GIG71849.1 membrane protein [Planosporangium flavigriseum]
MRKVLARSGAIAAGVLATVVLVASPASAHVTVNPKEATQGGYSKLTFRVPNEKDSAATTQVEVNLPQDAPITSVSVKPVNGWTAEVTKSKLDKPIKTGDGELTQAVTKIVWKADTPAAAIQPGQFQEFDVSAGPLPKVDKIVFKALQTYSDGDVVRWIEEPAADGKEPAHPAPTLKLVAQSSTSTAGGGAANAGANGNGGKDASAAEDGAADSRATLGVGLGIAALVVAIAGLVLAGLAWRRRPTA